MSFTGLRERSRDVQDVIERHTWGERMYVKGGGSYMKDAKGTDTQDTEVTFLDAGTSFNLKKDADAEVWAIASSSDTTLKMMFPTIPRDKQRRWMEEHGGIQHPNDPEKSLDFGNDLTHFTQEKPQFAVGSNGEFEIQAKDKKEAYLRLDKVIVTGELIVNKRIRTPQVVSGKQDPPKFSGNKQAEVNDKDDQQQGGGSQPALFLAVDNTVSFKQIETFVDADLPGDMGTITGMVIDCGTF